MPDLFISYAQVDNKPHSVDDKGWVTHFVNDLRNQVVSKLGRNEKLDLWMDFRLRGSDNLSEEIEKSLQATQILLILLSHGWLESPWCRRELELFSKFHAEKKGRIFIVEVNAADKFKDAPAILHDMLGYRFWQRNDQNRVRQLGWPVPLKTHTDYWEQIADLSEDLALALKNRQQTNNDSN